MIFYADELWWPIYKNPFTKDGSYGVKWSAFIYDNTINNYSNILENTKVYTLRVSPKTDLKYQRLVDFVNYETENKRDVIICVEENKRDNIKKVISDLSLENTTSIREKDPKWLVHSTTEELWKSIKKTGALLSPSELKKRKINVHEIGLKALLEPDDYSDYVMLDILDGCGEIVVSSRQLGYICTDANVSYKPGVRLYFDAHRIIQDGIATRDGLHILKVKRELTLDKYLVSVVTKELLNKDEMWTPTLYTKFANKYFEDIIGNV